MFDIFNFEKTEHGVGTLTELLGLIGTSRGGLDHPEEIHGTNCSAQTAPVSSRHGRTWWEGITACLLLPFGLPSDVSGYCSVAFYSFFILTAVAISLFEPPSNLLMVWTRVLNFIAWFTVLGALGLLPKDCWRQWLKSGGVAVLSGALVGQRGRRGMMLFLFCKVERNNSRNNNKNK